MLFRREICTFVCRMELLLVYIRTYLSRCKNDEPDGVSA